LAALNKEAVYSHALGFKEGQAVGFQNSFLQINACAASQYSFFMQ
jgi:hypothetical protein